MGGSNWNEIETSLALDWDSVGVGACTHVGQALRSAIAQKRKGISKMWLYQLVAPMGTTFWYSYFFLSNFGCWGLSLMLAWACARDITIFGNTF